jgi:hypothetical protein
VRYYGETFHELVVIEIFQPSYLMVDRRNTLVSVAYRNKRVRFCSLFLLRYGGYC